MIAKGVRFNAEKKQVGNYYSTKVSCINNTADVQVTACFLGLLNFHFLLFFFRYGVFA